MNERSGPASPLRKNNVSCRKASRHYRMIAAATWRRERAKAGRGFRFELPPSLRKGAA
jgi:hypothetical protein